MKVLFIPIDAHGHVNACIGIAQKLDDLGHRCVFALEEAWKGFIPKKNVRFEEVLYTDASRPANLKAGQYWLDSTELILDTLHESALYKAEHQNIQEFEEFIFNEFNFDDQLARIIKSVAPDVIVQDHYFAVPAVYHSGAKWIQMTSATPLSCIVHPDTPPTGSGLMSIS